MDSGDYKGIDSFLYLFLFQNHRGVVADYADFLRTFFEKDYPQRAYREFPALHVLSAWYYYLTGQHVEFAQHMDATIRNLPSIAKAGDEFVEYSILAYSVDHRTTMRQKVKLYGTLSRFLKKYTPEGLATNIASFSHNMPYMHRSNLDYSEMCLDPEVIEGVGRTFALMLGAEWRYIKPGLKACFLYEQNRLTEALHLNEQAKDLITEENKIEGILCVAVLQHSIFWKLGRQAEAERALAELDGLVDTAAQFFVPNLAAYHTRLRLWNGDLAAAREWLEQYFVVEIDHVELFRGFQHFVTARAHMALGECEEAERYLLLLREYGRNFNRPLDEGEACVLLAALHWAQGRKPEAAGELEDALAILQPYGYLAVIGDEGEAVAPILRRIAARIARPDYKGPLRRDYVNEALLAAHSFAKTHRGYLPELGREAARPAKLSRQQTQVLRLLAQGYRNAEICEITGLKLPTVKTHISLAYKKLGVNSAVDAVLKARELGFIE